MLTGRPPSGIHGIQMFGIRREQGRLVELAPVMRLLVGGGRQRGALAARAWRRCWPSSAWRTRRAASSTASAGEGFDALRASLWLASLTYLADACAAVGDEELAALLYPELAPLSGGTVTIGHGVSCYGSADRYLGMLAATLGEHDLARGALRGGARPPTAACARRPGSPTRCSRTGGRCARADAPRTSRPRPRCSTRPRRSPSAPACPKVLARARELGGVAASAAALPDELSAREADVLRLVATGASNREIGEQLFISGHTVANHVRSILRKTGAANRTEAAGLRVPARA